MPASDDAVLENHKSFWEYLESLAKKQIICEKHVRFSKLFRFLIHFYFNISFLVFLLTAMFLANLYLSVFYKVIILILRDNNK